MKKIFYLKAWHFSILFLILTLLISGIEYIEMSKFSHSFESRFTEMDENTLADNLHGTTNLVLFHDGESFSRSKMESNLSRLAENYSPDINYYKINVNECSLMHRKYSIHGVPSVLILKDGKEMNRILGIVSTSALHIIMDRIDP